MLSLKQIGTICFITTLSLLNTPSFAHITTSPVDCDANTLANATDGTVNLTAQYTANNIGITWYTDGDQTASGGSPTCTYDGTITLPTRPTKTGYEFGGWRVRTGGNIVNQCALASLDYTAQGTDFAYIDYDGGNAYNDDAYALVRDGQWAVEFSYGVIKGEALCSSIGGTTLQRGTPVQGGGTNCWCRIAEYMPNNGSNPCIYTPVWLFIGSFSEGSCDGSCAVNCTVGILEHSNYRQAMFGQTN